MKTKWAGFVPSSFTQLQYVHFPKPAHEWMLLARKLSTNYPRVVQLRDSIRIRTILDLKERNYNQQVVRVENTEMVWRVPKWKIGCPRCCLYEDLQAIERR